MSDYPVFPTTSCFQTARTEPDGLSAAHDPCLEGTEDCGDPSGEDIKLLAAASDGEPDRLTLHP
jgi:hypothetical protein